MKQLQKGFIAPLVLIIVAIAIGGGVYYSKHKEPVVEVVPAVETQSNVEVQKDKSQESKTTKKSTVLSLEEKARLLANTTGGECRKEGTIGVATTIDTPNEYIIFSINSYDTSRKNYDCVVDVYANTAILLSRNPICNSSGQCFGTGLLPTPRKIYDNIPTAPDPSTLR